VPGTFTYSPGAATILGAGKQTLSATFTPTDSTAYAAGTATVTIDVAKAIPTVAVSARGGTYDGSPFAATATVAGVGGAMGSSLEGASPTLTYYAGDSPVGAPLSGPPTAAGTYTVVAAFAGSADYASARGAPATFTIAPATVTVVPAVPVVSLSASTGSSFFGQSVTLTASVSLDGPGTGPPTGTVTFDDGGSALGTIPLEAGRAALTIGDLGPGDHSITAVYSGDAGIIGGRSGVVSESVSPSGTRIVLVPHAIRKGKRIVSLRLTAVVEPLAPGGGLPAGALSFLLKKKRPATVALSHGQATLTLKPGSTSREPLTVVYGGASGYRSSAIVTPRLTTRSLESLARAARGGPEARRVAHVRPHVSS
jgi:Big-like domain-containing protein